jgi:hypothetical protein
MIHKLILTLLTAITVFTLSGCNQAELNEESHAEYWNGLNRNQKQVLVTTEFERLKASGFTILVEEYYFIDRLNSYYTDHPPGELPVKDALKKIGFSTGVIQKQ